MNSPRLSCLIILFVCPLFAEDRAGDRTSIEPQLIHLRSGSEREWSDFPETSQGQRLDRSFDAATNQDEQTLLLRQQDVKQGWNVSLNSKKLGELTRDENDMIVAFAIPANTLIDGTNSLKIESPAPSKQASDDIRVGQIAVVKRPVRAHLSDASLEIDVVDTDSNNPLPCRITVLDENGAMATMGTCTHDQLAIRPGTAYTSTGRAKLELPAGHYTIFAGRGFEYSLAQTTVSLAAKETVQRSLSIRREVPTTGYVACDTHVHTLTFSGHGDATIDERMITLAGEGIEFPIATDHNVPIDYEEVARKNNVRPFFTPVVGNEVTTPRGHFNVFPITSKSAVIDHKQTDWGLLFNNIQQTPGVKACILNHARDLHSGVRPFGPALYNSVVAENLDGWPLRFNAMEVVNSGATQSDPMQLFHDWMGLLNRGLEVTPVGSSDSHDVSRYIVGQGRTYIRCDDRDPGMLNVDQAVTNFVQGHVMVSYGLLTEMTVNNTVRSGETASDLEDQVRVDIRVLGPHWSHADNIQLFANGHVIREAMIYETTDTKLPAGIKWLGGWTIPRPRHDVHLVAITTGAAVDGLHWPMGKPYQPKSPDWKARSIGCSGAIWLDVNHDGRHTSAREYAQKLMADAGNDWTKLVASLSDYNQAVAAHAAFLIQASGTSLQSESIVNALKKGASPATLAGFRAYSESWRQTEIARSKH